MGLLNNTLEPYVYLYLTLCTISHARFRNGFVENKIKYNILLKLDVFDIQYTITRVHPSIWDKKKPI